MASTSTENASSSFSPSSSSSITPRRRYKHDVFVSFRGLDTRKNFTSHLYAAFEQSGLTTFRDDENLERGASIDPALLRAIEESRFAVVVFSSDYASSSWCLTELAKIVECMDEEKLTVLPVFYDVDPSDVFNLKGTFEDAFAKHLKDNSGNIQKWKDAVTQVAGIAGWDLRDEPEATVIQKIVQRISDELDRTFSSVSNHLVGMDARVKEMLDLYFSEGLDVRFVGIYGMGGLGKTTLAREIYKRISGDFEASGFIENVRDNAKNQGLVSLQKQLYEILMRRDKNIWNLDEGMNILRNRLCNKKVLIVLDDVDRDVQLEALAGNRDWFGPGSRIIVTSRDSQLLSGHGMGYIHRVEGLNDHEALELFSWKAFKKPHPEENYVDLSKDFVNYAKGLPLALKVLGSSLFGKGMDVFRCARDKLKAEFNPDILDVLEISFHGLGNSQKKLFLDIAFFFRGSDMDLIRSTLNSPGYYLDFDIEVLKDKSLITIGSKRTLWMHDLLQQLGFEIVRRESPEEPGSRSRLCHYEDVMHVLKNNTGTKNIKGIVLEHEGRYHSWAINYQMKAVEPMEDKLVPVELNLEAFRKMKSLKYLKIANVHLPNGLIRLPNSLRWLDWKVCPLSSLPSSFYPKKLVRLDLTYSRMNLSWKGVRNFNCLKLVDFRDSQNLIETPDFTGTPNLEELLLSGCTRLSKIHASLGYLKRLIVLDLNGCKHLEIFLRKISLESLEIFDLGGCSILKKFPKIVGDMSRLTKLFLNNTAIKNLPSSVKHLIGLIELDLSNCKNLSSLVDAICSMTSLKTLTLSGCPKLDQLPKNLGNLKSLEKLHVNGTAIRELPSSFGLLKNLIVLTLHKCRGLSTESLTPFGIDSWSLVELDLSYCCLPAIPDIFGRFPFLGVLRLTGNNFVHLPESIIRLTKVIELHLNGCMHLQSLPKLPLNIQRIEANGCTSLEAITLTPGNYFHPFLRFVNCIKLIEYHGYDDMLLTMLRQYFQGENDINWVIPGSEIPIWFSHQRRGDSANLQVPSHLRDKKLIGMAICAVFILRKHHLKKPVDRNCLQFLINGQVLNPSQYICQKFGKIESYHLFLRYLPLRCFDWIWKKTLSQIDVNGSSQIEIKFSETKGPGLEFMKCGANLVFEQDIEDLNHDFEDSVKDTKIKRRCDDYDKDGAGPSGEDSAKDTKIKRRRDDCDKDGAGPSGEDSDKDTKIKRRRDDCDKDGSGFRGEDFAKDTKIKRRRDDCDKDGAGPSGEDSDKDTKIKRRCDDCDKDGSGTSNAIDVPHQKRTWFSNLIDKFMPGNWIRNGSTQGQGNFDCKEEESR